MHIYYTLFFCKFQLFINNLLKYFLLYAIIYSSFGISITAWWYTKIAFTNVNKKPTSTDLANCKMGTDPKYSPGVVAYPVTSIMGAKNEYQRGQGKYKIYINNGTTDISVNVGSHVLRNSFDSNDPQGFYQATLSLTESEI